ncbi:MAG: radical SAM protein [Luteitalea sp.]|nr:radical SAM protein [Luteitalea sp.]
MLSVRALLVSTYDLGHQPFGLASPAAWLRRDGAEVRCVDLAKEKLADHEIREADLIGFHLPMHTATRLAAPVLRKARGLNAGARICAYGLYAPLNEALLRSLGADAVFGGEYEADLATFARDAGNGSARPNPERAANGAPVRPDLAAGPEASTPISPGPAASRRVTVPKLHFLVPDRTGLPPLARYSTLQMGDGTSRVAGYTEASRGCRHLCRHCPIVPVYDGQFRVVQPDVVLADVKAQIAAGARHITFGDPDFFNGPTHAMRIVDGLHAAHPSVSYDATIKVEHLLQHRDLLPRLSASGCLFVTTAVESIDDHVLALLDKGHTRAGFVEAVSLCRAAGLSLVPTFVAFHPWTTLEGYCELLRTIASLGLVDHVAPIQLAIRLLIPSGSRLLELETMRPFVGAFDSNTLTYRWAHADPRVDALHQEISATVGRRLTADRRELFDAITTLAHERAALPRFSLSNLAGMADLGDPAAIAHFDEPWYCCAEPNPEQLTLV